MATLASLWVRENPTKKQTQYKENFEWIKKGLEASG